MKTPYMYRRKKDSNWYFQHRIPKDLRALYNGKSQIRFSLNTKNRDEAELLASEHRAKYLRQFKEHRTCYFHTSEGLMQFITDGVIFPEDINSEPYSYCTPLKKPIQAKSIPAIEEIRTQRQRETHKLSITNIAYHGSVLNEPVTQIEPEEYIHPEPEIDNSLGSLVNTASPISKPVSPFDVEMTLEELFDEFLKDKEIHAKANRTKISIKRENQLRVAYESFAAFINPNTPITQIRRAHIKDWRNLLVGMPTNVRKMTQTKNYSLEEIYQRIPTNEFKDMKTLSIVTINQKYLEIISSFFHFAVLEGYLQYNPAESKGLNLKPKESAKESRKPYPSNMLKRILNKVLGTKHELIIKLSLYTGMRMNEILQLTKDDIRQSSRDKVWYIDINTDKGKQVKTSSSKRKIPIPDILIQQGFLLFVNTCMTDTLFDIPLSKKTGYRSDTYTKRFSYFCKQHELLEDKCSFHSLRHNFKDYALEADVPEQIYKQLGGWSEDSVSGNYGKGHKLTKLKEHMDRIAKAIVTDLT